MAATLMEKMRREAGYRENYAMDHGWYTYTKYGNHECIRFNYGTDDEYQDANGATFDIKQGKWIG